MKKTIIFISCILLSFGMWGQTAKTVPTKITKQSKSRVWDLGGNQLFFNTGYVTVPRYITASLPSATNKRGSILFDSTTNEFKGSDGTNWLTFGTGAGSSIDWGDITGTITAQTDLVTYVGTKWDKSGDALSGTGTFGSSTAQAINIITNNANRIQLPSSTGQIVIPNNQLKMGSTGTNGYIGLGRSSDGATITEITVSGSTAIINTQGGNLNIQSAGTAVFAISATGVTAGGGAVSTNTRFRLDPGSATITQMLWVSSTLLTTKVAGAMTYNGDKWYVVINTGTAEKELAIIDATLTAGLMPVATTNGRLTNSGIGWDNTNSLLQVGGTSASFPGLQRSGTDLIARLANNSGNTNLIVLGEAYGAGWNGDDGAATKNDIYDKIEALGTSYEVIEATATTTTTNSGSSTIIDIPIAENTSGEVELVVIGVGGTTLGSFHDRRFTMFQNESGNAPTINATSFALNSGSPLRLNGMDVSASVGYSVSGENLRLTFAASTTEDVSWKIFYRIRSHSFPL